MDNFIDALYAFDFDDIDPGIIVKERFTSFCTAGRTELTANGSAVLPTVAAPREDFNHAMEYALPELPTVNEESGVEEQIAMEGWQSEEEPWLTATTEMEHRVLGVHIRAAPPHIAAASSAPSQPDVVQAVRAVLRSGSGAENATKRGLRALYYANPNSYDKCELVSTAGRTVAELYLAVTVDRSAKRVLHDVKLGANPELFSASALNSMVCAIIDEVGNGYIYARDIQHVTVPRTAYGGQGDHLNTAVVLPWVLEGRDLGPSDYSMMRSAMVDVCAEDCRGSVAVYRRRAGAVSGGLITSFALSGQEPSASCLRVTVEDGKPHSIFTHTAPRTEHLVGADIIDASPATSLRDELALVTDKAVLRSGDDGLRVRSALSVAGDTTVSALNVYDATCELSSLAMSLGMKVKSDVRSGRGTVRAHIGRHKARVTVVHSSEPVGESSHVLAASPVRSGVMMPMRCKYQDPMTLFCELSRLEVIQLVGPGRNRALIDVSASEGPSGTVEVNMRVNGAEPRVAQVVVGSNHQVYDKRASCTQEELGVLLRGYTANGANVRWLSKCYAGWAARNGCSTIGALLTARHDGPVNATIWQVGMHRLPKRESVYGLAKLAAGKRPLRSWLDGKRWRAGNRLGYIVLPPGHGKSHFVDYTSAGAVHEADRLYDFHQDAVMYSARQKAKRTGDWEEFNKMWASAIRTRLDQMKGAQVVLVPYKDIGELIGARPLGSMYLSRDQWRRNLSQRGEGTEEHEECYMSAAAGGLYMRSNEDLANKLRAKTRDWVATTNADAAQRQISV